MSDETATSERATDSPTAGQQVQRDVEKVIDHLRSGRTSTSEAQNVREAATRALADKAVAKAFRY